MMTEFFFQGTRNSTTPTRPALKIAIKVKEGRVGHTMTTGNEPTKEKKEGRTKKNADLECVEERKKNSSKLNL